MAGFGLGNYINPQVGGFIDQRRNALAGLGAGLLNGQPGAGVQAGVQADSAYAIQQKEQAERERLIAEQMNERNKTLEWLQNNFPEYAGLPAAQGWQAAMADLSAKNRGGGQSNFGLTPIWGVDASGNPVMGQMSSGGGIQPVEMPDGVTFGKDPIRLDAGSHFVLLDPVTRQQIGIVPKSGDVPTGYEPAPTGGGIAPMACSPQQTEVNAGKVKAATAINTLEQKNQIAVGAIDKALTNAGFWTTGIVGSLSSAVPGTPAYDLARTLDTIKANIGFEELQTMRDNSPTGGALGQVTERELAVLQSTIANIEQAQSESQLRENLDVLRRYLAMSGQQRRAAFEQQYGGAAPAGGNDIDSILGGYGL
jgi:hypothetical protein